MMKTDNGYELSDFSVDIYERGEFVHVKVDCFADDRINVPFHVYDRKVIDKELINDPKLFYYMLASMITRMLSDIMTSDINPPEKCECQDHYWLKTHPDDRQEYWRTKSGRIYPKAHTVKCPNNPANRRKNNG